MTPTPTAGEIEAQLRVIITESQTGTSIHGCDAPLEVYAWHLQKEILEPLLKARADAGLAAPIDDLGHNTPFTAAWNRALRGESKDWDCRVMAQLFINMAIKGNKDVLAMIVADRYEPLDQAVIAKVPGYLTGEGMPSGTFSGLRSWVEGTYVHLRLDGLTPVLEDLNGFPLSAPVLPPAALDVDFDSEQEPFEIYGLMSFQGGGISHEEGVKAWQAWQKTAKDGGLLAEGFWDSMLSLAYRSVLSLQEMKISWQQLRQDECISVDAGPRGVIVYRGQVTGLTQIMDEGQFLCGPRSAFLDFLKAGGFTQAEAGQYLDRLAETSSAFRAKIPGNSKMRFMTDAETLYAFDRPDDEATGTISQEDALPILAAGIFDMPDMTTHRSRLAALQATEEPAP